MRGRILLVAACTAAVAIIIGFVWLARDQRPRGRVELSGPMPAAPTGGALSVEATNAAPAGNPASTHPPSVARISQPSTAFNSAETGAFESTALYGQVLAKPEEGQAQLSIEGARVLVFPGFGLTSGNHPILHEAVTDGAGRFRVRDLEELTPYHVYIQAEGWVPFTRRITSGIDNELLLARAVGLRGRVLTLENEMPLPGLEVRSRALHFQDGTWSLDEVTTTDAEGRFALAWNTPGATRLFVGGLGRVPTQHRIMVEADSDEEFELLVDEGEAVLAELSSWPGEAPLGGLEFSVDGHTVTSDGGGGLSLTLVSKKRATLKLAAEGYCTTQARVGTPGEKARGAVRLHLAKGAVLEGFVRNAEGQPLAGARVFFARSKGESTLARPSKYETLVDAELETESDEQGHFRLEGIVPRVDPLRLHASLPSYGSGTAEVAVAVPERSSRVDFTLYRGASLGGRITVDGQPDAARVHWKGSGTAGSAQANDDGRYHLSGVEPGDIEVWVTLSELKDFRDAPRPFRIADGETLAIDISLETGRLPVRGQVVDADGIPVPGVRVSAYGRADPSDKSPEGVRGGRTISEENGRFELLLEPLAAAGYRLNARVGTRVATLNYVRAGTSECELVLPLPGYVGLDVRDASSDEPLANIDVFWRPDGRVPFRRYTRRGGKLAPNAEGVVWLELPRGEADLRVGARRAGYPSLVLQRTPVLGADEARPEILRLARGTRLLLLFQEVGVKKRSNPPGKLRGLHLATDGQHERRRGGGDWYRDYVEKLQSATPKGGRAVIRGIGPGLYKLRGKPNGVRFTPKDIRVLPGEEQRVVVRWKRNKKNKGKNK